MDDGICKILNCLLGRDDTDNLFRPITQEATKPTEPISLPACGLQCKAPVNDQDLVFCASSEYLTFDNRWKSTNDVVDCEIADQECLQNCKVINRSTLRRLKICGINESLFTGILDLLKGGPLVQLEIDTMELSRTSKFSMENVFDSLRVLSIDSVRLVNGSGRKIGSPTFAFNAPNLTTVYLGECRGI